MEAQSKTFNQMEKTLKELRARVDLLIEKANRLSKKSIRGRKKGGWRGSLILKTCVTK